MHTRLKRSDTLTRVSTVLLSGWAGRRGAPRRFAEPEAYARDSGWHS